jgi:hypothetical protein
MPMIVLHSKSDWENHRKALCVANGVQESAMQWGAGPAAFPCMAASRVVSPRKVLSCYVYVSDALTLLKAAGVTVEEKVPSDPGPVVAPKLGESRSAEVKLADSTGSPDVSRAFERSLAAHVLTLMERSVEVGLFGKDGMATYATSYAKHLSAVNQAYEIRKSELSPAKAAEVIGLKYDSGGESEERKAA